MYTPAAHKEQTGCNGKRDRTAFVGRGHWNERYLLSDYRFLEEVKLADDVAKRSRPPAPKQELPPFLQTLIYQARRRGVQLHILAPGMAKRVHNSTRYDPRQRLLRWRVEWDFVGAFCKVVDERAHENTKVGELLRAHLTLQPGEALKHHQLREYVDAAAQGTLAVVMRKERTPANAPEYYPIDPDQVLSRQLAGKVLVEYPTFLVLLPSETRQYKLVSAAPGAGGAAAAPDGGGAPVDGPAGAAAGAAAASGGGGTPVEGTAGAAAGAAAASIGGGAPVDGTAAPHGGTAEPGKAAAPPAGIAPPVAVPLGCTAAAPSGLERGAAAAAAPGTVGVGDAPLPTATPVASADMLPAAPAAAVAPLNSLAAGAGSGTLQT
ncbi:hypothetical protein N2152v2_010341 [Parachlorella kessleri]